MNLAVKPIKKFAAWERRHHRTIVWGVGTFVTVRIALVVIWYVFLKLGG